MPVEDSVAACNRLTASWCAATAGAGDHVVSGAGVWPLLAMLASGASGTALTELETAAGYVAAEAQLAAREFFGLLKSSPAISAALDIWVRADVELRSVWAGGLPRDVVQVIGSNDDFDAWASRHTLWLSLRFPIQVDPSDLVVLATAFAAVTRWRQPFEESWMEPRSGPWKSHRGPALRRHSAGTDSVSILNGHITRVIVTGTDDVDVHLLLGTDPILAVTTGIAALTGGGVAVQHGADLPLGHIAPGLSVKHQPCQLGYRRFGFRHAPEPRTSIELPPFEIRSTHDLTDHADIFGLTAALDTSRGHFPAMSDTQVAISKARQDTIAEFTAEGFKVAAITRTRSDGLRLPRRTGADAPSRVRPGLRLPRRPT